jgi:hypothetical protein
MLARRIQVRPMSSQGTSTVPLDSDDELLLPLRAPAAQLA